ncbi:hypothetical protein BC936DRAFT_149542 [Jimgerdemannia flammicorona]|uniref:DUF7779 domain-containing protein n=1 Tax=Jimgerdemannia flammicorona TaxID=994334 RepID=A0A433D0M6_9FUNG|nr:hypothetical protein BC936DRAFT_149542 [Jimgerdemannia flammicorona]
MAFTPINEKNPLAADILKACAFLYPDNIPLRLFEAQSERIFSPAFAKLPHRSLEAINLLCSSSLVRHTAATTAKRSNSDVYREKLSIHHLVQTIVGLEIDNAERLEWCERLISGLRGEVDSNFEQLDNEYFTRVMEVYGPHIQQVVLQFQKWEAGLSDISNDLPFVDRPLSHTTGSQMV